MSLPLRTCRTVLHHRATLNLQNWFQAFSSKTTYWYCKRSFFSSGFKILSIYCKNERKNYLVQSIQKGYLTIIPRARMGSESIAFGLMGYWLRGHEGETLILFCRQKARAFRY